MMTITSDVVIIGAGPAGCACALSLAESGLDVVVLDKNKFPREKICGDGLGKDVIRQLEKYFPDVKKAFDNLPQKLYSRGMRMVSPDNTVLDIELAKKGEVSGYVCQRRHFDNLLFNYVKQLPNVLVIENTEVKRISGETDAAFTYSDSQIFSSKIVVAADGPNSVAAKKMAMHKTKNDEEFIAVRAYYEGISGMHKDDFIEMHFYEEFLPGYLWIFPMYENTANVGINVMSKFVTSNKVSLKSLLEKYINEHPLLAHRFRNAKRISDYGAGRIALCTRKRRLSGERFILAGDAAWLVDPFTGEGIANAIRSGRMAAEHVMKCFTQNQFSARFNKEYDKCIYDSIWKEMRLNSMMQKLAANTKIVNYVVNKAKNSDSLKSLIVAALENPQVKKDTLKKLVLKKVFSW